MNFRVALFERDGKRFLIPGIWHTEDSTNSAVVSFDAMTFGVIIGATYKFVTIATDADGALAIKNHEEQMVGRQFAHGSMPIIALDEPLPETGGGHAEAGAALDVNQEIDK